jgi:hypothetical protein
MAAALNTKAFEKPHWGLMARGFALDDWFGGSGGSACVERNGGIENPWRTHLKPGCRYYRFTDNSRPDPVKFGGGWWMDFEQLHKVMEACPSRGLNLSQMARTFLAVPWEWNAADAIVTGILMAPMDAYEGRGRPVRVGKSYVGNSPVDSGEAYPGNPNVLQLFIPDMRTHWKSCLGQTTVQEVRDFAKDYRDILRV